MQLPEAQAQQQKQKQQGHHKAHQVLGTRHQQIAEQQAIEIHRQLQRLDQQHPDSKAEGQHGVEHRLRLATAGGPLCHQQFGQQHGSHGAPHAPEQHRPPQGLGDHHARQHGVGHQVGAEHPPLHHQQRAQQGTHQSAQACHQERQQPPGLQQHGHG